MPIDALAYRSARAAIRELLVLGEDEIVDLVFLASVIANFDPSRQVPIWLVITGEPASGKTELTDLLHGWQPVWTLPDPITSGYFASINNDRTNKWGLKSSGGSPGGGCAIRQIERTGARILYLHDMLALFTCHPRDSARLYSQLVGIHDGFMKYETGGTLASIVYGPKPPSGRLGFVSTATDRFYEWQKAWTQVGTRFLLYRLAPRERWEDTRFLTTLALETRRQEKRDHARAVVQEFFSHAVAEIGSLEAVEIERSSLERLSAAVNLVQRTLAASGAEEGGARLHTRVVQLARIFAWMQGEGLVANRHILDAARVTLSQLPPQHLHALLFAIRRDYQGEAFIREDVVEAYGRYAAMLRVLVESLEDLGILESAGKVYRFKSYRKAFRLAPRARELVRAFDPQGVLFPLAEGGTVPNEDLASVM